MIKLRVKQNNKKTTLNFKNKTNNEFLQKPNKQKLEAIET